MLALEPRWVFDGAGVVTEPDLWPSDAQDRAAATAPTPDLERPAEPAALPASLSSLGSARSELVVVDGSLADLQTLLNDIRQASPERSVLVLDPGGKELEQLSTHLQQHPQAYDAIHLLSHGGEGWIRLGSQVLTLGDAGAQAALWNSVKSSLSADGDLLLYGCNIASGPEGRASVEQLAHITGADVAASTDVTGGADGNWMLEQQVGAVEAQSLEPAIWQGVLAAPTVSNPIVNEGSPYVVFKVTISEYTQIDKLELRSGTATVGGVDAGGPRGGSFLASDSIEYMQTTGSNPNIWNIWKWPTGGAQINVTDDVYVRVPIVNDLISDNTETIFLDVKAVPLITGTVFQTFTGTATIKDDGTGQWFTGTTGVGSNSAPAGSVLDNDAIPLSVTSPTVGELDGFAQWDVQYGAGKKVLLELVNLTAAASSDLLPFSSGNLLQYDNGSGWVDYTPGSQVEVGSGNALQVRARINAADGPESIEQLKLRVQPVVGMQYDISGTTTLDIDIAKNAARPAAADNIILNGDFTQRTGGTDWKQITHWTASGGGPSTYAKVYANESWESMPGLYFGNQIAVGGVMPTLDANGVTTTGTDLVPKAGYGDTNNPVAVTQTVATTAGQTYVLQFSQGYEPMGGGSPSQTGIAALEVNGQRIYFAVYLKNTAYSFVFTANSSSTTIKFMSWGHVSGVHTELILNDVSLSAVPDATGTLTITPPDLTPAPLVNDVTVNEASPYAVFSVEGVAGAVMTLALADGASSAATVGTDTGTNAALQYYDASANSGAGGWVAYGSSVTVPASGVLRVRTAIVNDDALEVTETFTLTATYTGVVNTTINPTGTATANGNDAGTGTIKDNGTGSLYSVSNTTGVAEAVGTNGLPATLDDDRRHHPQVNNVSVNEASPYAVFTVTGLPEAGLTLSLGNTSDPNDRDASVGTDTANTLQVYRNGAWVAYSAANSIVNADGTLLVRVAVNQDTAYEGPETLTLTASYNSNGTAANPNTSNSVVGTATIRDDGSGNIYPNNATGATDATATKDDDRPITVSNIDVNEDSSTAVFTITGTAGQTINSLVLAAGTATSGTDYLTALEYSVNNGATWQPFTQGTTTFVLDANGKALVRNAIQDDAPLDGGETYTLTATPLGGNAATGTATIRDDASGDIFTATGAVDTATARDDDRTIKVQNVCVNEGSPYAVWTINYNANAQVLLELTDGTASVATDLLGSGSKLEYLSGSTWTTYTAGTAVSVDGTGKLLVRVAINNDTPFENVETLSLTARLPASQPGTAVSIPGVTHIREIRGTSSLASSGQSNLIVNGDFTTLQGGAGVSQPSYWGPNRPSPINLAGWVESGGGTETYANIYEGGAYFGNFAGWQVTYNGVQLDNSQDYLNLFSNGDFITGSFSFAHVNKTASEVGNNANPVALTQTIATQAGTSYRLQFDQRGEFDGLPSTFLPGMAAVEIGGQRIHFKVPFKNTWSTHTLEFTATSASTTIKFMSWGHLLFLNNPSDTTDNRGTDELVLDKVIVQEAASSTATLTIKDNGQGCSWFEASNTTGIADPNGTLNDDRVNTPLVNDLTVNEGSPHAVFTVQGLPGAEVTLAIAEGAETAGTSAATDVSGLQWFNAATSLWVNYSTAATIGADGTLLVRTSPVVDSAYEQSETFTLTATYNGTGGGTNGGSATGTGTIKDDATGQWFTGSSATGSNSAPSGVQLDDDRPLAVNNIAVNEGSTYAVFEVSGTTGQLLSLALQATTASSGNAALGTDTANAGSGVPLQVFNGTAWVDYTPSSLITIPAGNKLLVRTRLVNDAPFEGPETFNLVATNAGGTSATGTATIYDDGSGDIYPNNTTGAVDTAASKNDDRPSFAVSDVTRNEAAGTMTFTITKSGTTELLATVNYATADGTATAGNVAQGADYQAANGTLSFAANETSKTVTINIGNNNVFEGTETFNLNLSAATNASISDATGVGTIKDDGTGAGGTSDDRPLFTVDDVTVNEGAGTMTFTVTRTGDATLNSTVAYTTASGTATSGTDFTAASGTLTFAPGETTKTITVPITNDAGFEGSETLTVTLSSPSNALIWDGTGVGTILDDGKGAGGTDDDRTLKVSDVCVNEGSPYAVWTVEGTAGDEVMLALVDGTATAASDLTGSGSKLQVLSGSGWVDYTSGAFIPIPVGGKLLVRVAINNDAPFENVETLTLQVSGELDAGVEITNVDEWRALNFAKSRFVVSSFHSGFYKAEGGGYYVAGENIMPNGTAEALLPRLLTPANGYTYTGSIIDVAAVSDFPSHALLTTDGLWLWGTADKLLTTGTTAFTKITLPGGFNPANVRFMSASEGALGFLMNDGTVRMAGNAEATGGATSDFGQVTLSDGSVLSGITDLEVGSKYAFAYSKGSNKFYTWGTETSLGDNTAPSSRTYATEMISPLPAGVSAVQIGVAGYGDGDLGSAGFGSHKSYFVLGSNGRVYALGSDWYGQLGQGPGITDSSQWVTVKNPSGTGVLEGVQFISAQNQTMANVSIAAIVSSGSSRHALMGWGNNGLGALGLQPASVDAHLPKLASGAVANQEVFTVEVGGHFSAALLYGCDGNVLTAGHNVGGAFGTGTTNDHMGGFVSLPFITAPGEPALAGSCSLAGITVAATLTIKDNGQGCSWFEATNTTGLADANGPLNDDRGAAPRVNSLTVNEGSPYAVFTVQGLPGANVDLAIVEGTDAAGSTGADVSGLQWFDATNNQWVNYSSVSPAVVNADGTVLVRTTPVNDTVFETSETFDLTATYTNNAGNTTLGVTLGASATGVGTIKDDGTGQWFTGASDTGSDSAPVGIRLNDDRTVSVNSITVNEASPYAVFNVTGTAGQYVSLALAPSGSGAGHALLDTDTQDAGSAMPLQYYNGTAWVDYTPGSLVPMPATTLLVRTRVMNDTPYEGAETFTLVATNAGGLSATGTCTITDDGTGNLYSANNTTGTAEAAGTNGLASALNDDRPITVSDLQVNEATGNAVFTLSGTAGQVVNSLVLAAGTATSGTDYGTSLSYSVNGGTNWLSYTHGTTTITIPAGGSFLVRNSITNDSPYEGAETYTLTATPRGGNAATGTATIFDDGTGTGGTNDDRAANPSVNDLTVNEGSPYTVFSVQGLPGAGMTLSLANGTSSPATIGTDTGAAAALEYYSATANGGAGGWLTYSSSVTLPASGTLLVRTTITNDAPLEVSETFRLTATYNGSGGGTNGGSDTGIGTITDDGTGNLYSASNTTGSADALGSQADLPAALDDDRPSFSVGDVTYNEAAGTITFTVTKTGSTAQSTTVAYATSDGTAVAGQDYTATSGTLTFAAGDTTKTVTVPITNDAVFELSETLNLNLSNPTNARIGDGLGVGTITDDGSGTGGTNDDRPSFAVNDVLVNEAAGTLTFTVSKTGSTTQIATVAYAIADGSGATGAASGSDYSAGTDPLTGTLSFAAGETSKTVTIAITSDSTFENLEELLINLSSASNATISDAQGVGRILDLPAVSIGNATVIEATDPYAVVTVSLSQASALPMTFTPTLANAGTGAGFAVVGTDTQSTPSGAAIEYSLNGTTWLSAATGVTVPAGTTSVQLRSAIKMNDGIGEPIETYTIQTNALSFASGSNSFTATSVSGTVTIIDNPTMSISSVAVNEASPYAVVQVSLSLPASSAISFTPSLGNGSGTAGTDTGAGVEYFNGASWVSAAGGITIPVGGTGVLLRTAITPDALDEVSETINIITGPATNVLNSAGVTGTITIRDQGTDATPANNSVFTATNNTATPDSLTPTSAAVVDPLNLPSGQVLLDDDRPLSVNNRTVNEGSPFIVFTVTGAANQYVRLSMTDGSASIAASGSPPTDGSQDYGPALQYFDGAAWQPYTAGSFVKIPGGGTTLLVRTAVVNDSADEGSQTFNLRATNTGGTSTPLSQGIGTIIDDGTGSRYSATNNTGAADTTLAASSAVVDPNALPANTVLLNDDRPIAVNSVEVNEASPYLVWTVTAKQGQYVQLEAASGTALMGQDTASVLEFFDGQQWQSYTPDTFVRVPGNQLSADGLLRVRVGIVNDFSFEDREVLTLTARNVSLAAATGLGAIRDDGRGSLFGAANTTGEPDGLAALGLQVLDDDRLAAPLPQQVAPQTRTSESFMLPAQPSLHVQQAVAESRQLAGSLSGSAVIAQAGTSGPVAEGRQEMVRTDLLIAKFDRVTDPALHVQNAVHSSRQQSNEAVAPAFSIQTGLLRESAQLDASSQSLLWRLSSQAEEVPTLADQTLEGLARAPAQAASDQQEGLDPLADAAEAQEPKHQGHAREFGGRVAIGTAFGGQLGFTQKLQRLATERSLGLRRF